MARPREFDDDAALDAAIQRFWKYGYEATSVRDLAESMGITCASLYNAFGDKQSVYRMALERYLDKGVRERIARLESSLPPLQAIVAFFGEVIEHAVSDRQGRGCMLVNTALEVAPHEPALRRLVADELAKMEAFFLRCLRAGRQDGTYPMSQAPEDVARLMLSVVLGIRVLARTRPRRDALEGLLKPVLGLIGLAPSLKERTTK